jgi:dTDP-4-dehydrorhamnose 3,5-epimerase
LSADNNHMLWIPPGFAHGFLALEDKTVFLYKCTKPYNKDSESGIIWNDSDLNINWGITNPIVSVKDQELPAFKNLNSGF